MRQIEALLFIYDDLSSSERSEADVFLKEHPEMRARVEEGRRLRGLLEAAAPRAVSDADLATIAVLRASAGEEALLARLEARLAEALQEDPALAERLAELEARYDALNAGLPSPAEHFEHLRNMPPASPPRHQPPRRPAPAGDRPQRKPARRARLRLPVAALLIVGVLFGSLYLASETTRPAYERAAALAQLPPPPPALRLRGADGVADLQTERYVDAVESVRSARRSVAGLFVRYDEAALRAGLADLRDTYAMNPAGAIGLEARFAMARVHLHLGEIPEARLALEEVVEREGPSAPHARRLLEELSARGIE
jgi:anti-sigma factor RsiW